MPSVRMNITLPNEVVDDLNAMVDERKRSAFIAESLQHYIALLKRQDLESNLIEGYQSTKDEGLSISRDFETADCEGWDDY